MPRYVAFFRNVYNGRPLNPDKTLLETAFLESGAIFAHSFLANGTVIFDCDSDPFALAELARQNIESQCGCEEPVYIREMSLLSDLVEQDPWISVRSDDVHEYCYTLLPPGSRTLSLPFESTRKDAKILLQIGEDVFGVSYMIDGRSGYPTKLVESKFKLLATTRNWRTIQRLVQNHK